MLFLLPVSRLAEVPPPGLSFNVLFSTTIASSSKAPLQPPGCVFEHVFTNHFLVYLMLCCMRAGLSLYTRVSLGTRHIVVSCPLKQWP